MGGEHKVTWEAMVCVCGPPPPRERPVKEQRHPSWDARGLGLTEKSHAWALQRFGLFLT